MSKFSALFSVLFLPALFLFFLWGVTRPGTGPTTIIINEIAWAGTPAASSDEWLELYNNTSNPIDLTNWTLTDGDGGLSIILTGTIPANGFFLLERTDDNTISNIPADQIYVGSLSNSGESLTLRDAGSAIIDTANNDGGGWPDGTVAPNYLTMERIDPSAPDSDANWADNTTVIRNGLDANGDPLNGTPKQDNSVWFSGGSGDVLLEAVLYDGYETSDIDEAVQLRNVSDDLLDLAGWKLSDGTSTAIIPAGTLITPNQTLWLTNDESAFTRQFGFAPDIDMTSWPGFANSGDEVILLTPLDQIVDVLVYGSGNASQTGWNGAAVEHYSAGTLFGGEGQILYRQRDPLTNLLLPDTDTEADWSPSLGDPINGRKVRYPGWDFDTFFFTAQLTETAVLTVAIAPDNAYQAIVNEIDNAAVSLQIESLTFENVAIANALVDAANRGVAVTVLLEGSPAGGLADQERWVCEQIENAGGQCWFMISDDAADTFDRYRFMHAKFIIVDSQIAIVSSENLSSNSLPNDDKSDGTWGRRGVVLLTDAPSVVSHLQTVFALDLDPANHLDIFRWLVSDEKYGAPPAGFVPITTTGGTTYTVRYPTPIAFNDTFPFEIVQSPENSLRNVDSLLGLVNQAGAGDTVLVQQLQERPYWGASSSNPTADPNPRLEAYLNAARRGARVRLLLDDLFNDPSSPVSNSATCAYVLSVALAEGLALECELGNPAGLGIHNKMVLVQLSGRGYIHIGSLNGSEQASKGNREIALQVQSDGAYALLADMFTRDWPYSAYLPILPHNALAPASYPLISEVLYDPSGMDEAEFIEIVNPTGSPIDISNWSIGDAVNMTDFEDVRRFPAGTILPAQNTLVIALTATSFNTLFGFNPDFEIVETDPTVPNLIDDPAWGDPDALLQLANGGDEVLLRNDLNLIIDAIAYGTGNVPGTISCPLVTATNYSLERLPYNQDTDNCSNDFREWPFPNPGNLP